MPYETGPLRALITGGSSGIGLAIAMRLAAKGVSIAVLANEFPQLEGDEAAMMAKADSYVFDLRNTIDIPRIVDEIGQVDFLVNCAAVYHGKPYEEYTDQEIEDLFDVNVLAPEKLTRSYVKKGGLRRVVNMASIVAHTGGLDEPYAKSKKGLVEQTKRLAPDLAFCGISINAVSPGVVEDTAMFERIPEVKKQHFREHTVGGVFLTPREIAECVEVLLLTFSPKITGQEFILNNGPIH